MSIYITGYEADPALMSGDDIIPFVEQAGQRDAWTTVTKFSALLDTLPVVTGTANGVLYLNGSKVVSSGSALTFDGTRLTVNSGATSEALRLNATADTYLSFQRSGTGTAYIQSSTGGMLLWNQENTAIQFGVNNAEQMRLTSTGLGIGTSSPATKLDVAITGGMARFGGVAGNNLIQTYTGSIGAGIWAGGQTRFYTTGVMTFAVGATLTTSSPTGYTDAMTLDSSGNLGLGVTPSAWDAAGAGGPILQIRRGLLFGANTETRYLFNTYYGTGDFRYIASSIAATNYQQAVGQHRWFVDANAASPGAADTIVTFTQAMTLDASGNLIVGGTSQVGSSRLSVVRSSAGEAIRWTDGATGGALGTVVNVGCNFICDGSLLFSDGATERARITSGGNFKIGGTADRATTEGDKQVVLFNGTAPVGTLANGVSFYSASGEANVMDAAGNATLLSPHDAETNEWIFRSKHTPTGKVLKIDVERLLKFVNDHFGLDAVHEFIEA